MTDTIKPSNAISIWATPLSLYAECPSPDGRSSHLVKLPLSPDGLTVLLNMLKARRDDSKIGEKGDLTKYQIKRELQAIARGHKPTKIEKPIVAGVELRASIRQLLRDNGF